MNLSLPDFLAVGVLVAILQWIATKWLESRITQSIKHEYDRKLEGRFSVGCGSVSRSICYP